MERSTPRQDERALTSVSGRAIDLFRISGIRVRVDYSWFFLFLLILSSLSLGYLPKALPDLGWIAYLAAGAVATLLFFLSLLAHELSHSLVAQRAGMEIPAITLFLFGGVSEMREEPRSAGLELKIAAAGPLMSFALGAAFFTLRELVSSEGLSRVVLSYLAWVNVALGVFNLLPGLPLDGGRILRALVWKRTGSVRRATRVAADAGKGLAVGLMILGGLQIFGGALVGGMWLVLIGLFLRSTAEAGYHAMLVRHALAGATAADGMFQNMVIVPGDATLRRVVDDYFLAYGYRGFPVVDAAGNVLGLITIDQVRAVPRERWDEPVADHRVALSDAIRTAPDAPLLEALSRISRSPTGRLLVMDGDRLLGMLSKDGLLRYIEIRQLID